VAGSLEGAGEVLCHRAGNLHLGRIVADGGPWQGGSGRG
jgi:hypothetical protein